MNKLAIGVSIAGLLALGACTTTNQDAYERALRQKQTTDNASVTQGLKEATSLSGEEANDPNQYRLADAVPGLRPPLDSDEAGLWMMMDKTEQKLKTAGHRYRDQDLNEYVRSVACRIAQDYCKDIRVYVMRIPAFNATMAPNGVMEVWTGLLLRVENEAQLASVLGHEMGHYLRRHTLQKMRTTVDTANALAFFQIATAGAGLGFVGQVATLAAVGGLQANSRDFEREADGYGSVLMANAGYDPRQAAIVWRRLIRERDADDNDESPSLFLASHPASEERVEALEALAEESAKGRSADDIGRDRYRAAIKPHRAQFLKDELKLRRFNRTQELLAILKEDSGESAEILYFEGELYRLRGKDGDDEKALQAYQAAQRSGTPPPALHRSMGLLRMKQKEFALARESFAQYLQKQPDAEDAAMIRHMMNK